ncbi:MAG: hypothetical protein ACM3WQ_00580 [Chloroflexota bacterium]|nr:hypothetical protein [Candidatus Sulfotelmatobacter sp.]
METYENSNNKPEGNNQPILDQISRMKCIRCPECGEPILMVPTLGKMIEAIENHISIHRKSPNEDRSAAQIRRPFIRDNLTEQLFQHAADSIEPRRNVSPWL